MTSATVLLAGIHSARNRAVRAIEACRVVFRSTALIALSALAISCTSARADLVQDEIRLRVDGLASGSLTMIGGVPITVPDFVSEFYALRSSAPAWAQDSAADDLMQQLTRARRQGFRLEDFHTEELATLRDRALSGDPAAIADYDIVATQAAAALLHHIYYGKVNPAALDSDWNFEGSFRPGNPAKLVNQYLKVATLGALIGDFELLHPTYLAMQAGLEQYQGVRDKGGWPNVPDGLPLKPGEQDPRVPVLRQRLGTTSGSMAPVSEPDLYDTTLEAAVKAFQQRHGLEPDGVIGPRTYQALNRSVEFRIDQLRVSLERARWILRDLENDFVLVNIAGAETYLVMDGELVWKTRSIVGQQYRKTPIFQDEITYIDFNPTWTVPVSIFRKDKLSRIRKDPNYLTRGGYDVVNAQGQVVAPSSVNWMSDNPPVTLVQRPGAKNALGQVKFMFPNKYSVYLHDTDNHALFDRADRTLSSGCIRIENPFDFADLLLADDPKWSADQRTAILASGRTTRINLPKPMPVLLTYYTAWKDSDGQVQFREDVYERDQAILGALNSNN